MLKLYGLPWSRALRCLWLLYEIGEPFELVRIDGADLRSADYLALNPNAKMPTLVDGDVVLWESMAINLYLAQTRSTPLSPRGRRELGEALTWTLWAQSELEEFFNHVASLDDVTDAWLDKTFGVLAQTLERRAYLLGDRFTVADLNVCSMWLGPVSSQLPFDRIATVRRWIDACRARPAFRRAVSEAFGGVRADADPSRS